MATPQEIERFCKVCDFYKPGQRCRVAEVRQRLYVDRNWCGWATVEKSDAITEVTRETVRISSTKYQRGDNGENDKQIKENIFNYVATIKGKSLAL